MRPTFKTNYDTLTTRPERGPEFYLARHLRKKGLRGSKGDGRLARFREVSKYKRVSVADVIEGRLDQFFTCEFRFYQWNVMTFCAYCSARLTRRSVTRDHVVPQAKGGTSAPDNLVPCCAACNNLKADKPLWKFLLERGRGHARAVQPRAA